MLVSRIVGVLRNPFLFASGRSTQSSQQCIKILEEDANRFPLDLEKQALFYEDLANRKDFKGIIHRYESGLFGKNKRVFGCYIKSLLELRESDKLYDICAAKIKPIQYPTGSKTMPVYIKNISDHTLFHKAYRYTWLFVGIGGSVVVGYGIVSSFLQSGDLLQKGGLGEFQIRKYSKEEGDLEFASIPGCDDAKKELERIIMFLKNPDVFSDLGAKMPKGILLMGPSGTGKTLLARAVAKEAGVPFLYASGSEFDEMYVGIGSMRIRKLFETAKKNSPSIVFIDEIDAIGSKRNPQDPQHSRMSLNQLLVEMDGFSESHNVVVMGATNHPNLLDNALLRPGRFDKHISLPYPDVSGRKNIIELYLKGVPGSREINLWELARSTSGLTGADLFKLINNAKILASLRRSRRVSLADIEESRDEIIMGGNQSSVRLSDEEKKKVAYHEGGHALVAHLTSYSDAIHKATILPRGMSLGFVSQVPETDTNSINKAQLLAKIDILLAGRVAEEIVFGKDLVTTGSSDDFEKASEIARNMVTKYGMSDSIGFISYGDVDGTSQEKKIQSITKSKRLYQRATPDQRKL